MFHTESPLSTDTRAAIAREIRQLRASGARLSLAPVELRADRWHAVADGQHWPTLNEVAGDHRAGYEYVPMVLRGRAVFVRSNTESVRSGPLHIMRKTWPAPSLWTIVTLGNPA